MFMRKSGGLLLPFAFLLLITAEAENGGKADSQYPQAPEFSLKDLKGSDISLSSYKGKVIFLNFWATWCPPCRAEIPDFVEIYGQYKEKGMEIIGISVDRMSPSSLMPFVEKFKINYPVALYTPQVIKDYQPGQFIPTTIIIDKQGRIRHKHVGQLDKETLKDYFLHLAEEKS